eukprot:Gb_27373 [translate_table: standard]
MSPLFILLGKRLRSSDSREKLVALEAAFPFIVQLNNSAMTFRCKVQVLLAVRSGAGAQGEAYGRGEKIDFSKFEADPGLPASLSSSPVEISTSPESADQEKFGIRYRCKKCRRVVASQENVLGHLPGEGETCFRWKRRYSGHFLNESEVPECSSIFVEPLQWMATVEEGAIEGKLSCIGCQARLGYFNWSGIQCSCGTWVSPSFQLHKSRVDASTV